MRFNIYKDGKNINTIISDEEFCKKYCKKNNYSYAMVEDSKKEEYVFTREDEIDSMMIDHEYRITLIELGVNE